MLTVNRLVMCTCAAGYLLGACQVHAIALNVVSDDHQRHTGPTVIATSTSSSSNGSTFFTYVPNTVTRGDFIVTPRETKAPAFEWRSGVIGGWKEIDS